MKLNDAVTGVFLLLFAIGEMLYTRTFPQLSGQSYGPNLFPVLVGAGLAICGCILIARGYRARASVPLFAAGGWAKSRRHVLDVIVLLAAVLAYVIFSDFIGFIPLSLLILSVLLYRLGSSIAKSLLVATAATFVLHTIFSKALLVPLPWGLLSPVAW